ncbi:MAG: glycerate kinase, partial [Verrucomicrobiota bacterium]
MKVLVAPDKFKGSLSAVAAAEAIARGFLSAWPHAELQIAPIADGGEGFAEALCVALEGEWVYTTALDPIGRKVEARYAWIDSQKLAVIEMSEASGLWRLQSEERDPLRATTFGTGQLMRHATARGARTILVGLGGSATTDGGIGMAQALGYEFLTAAGEPISTPGHLQTLGQIRTGNALVLPQVIAACDVQNPLLGERGTSFVFAPQKGADPKTVELLEEGMRSLAEVVTRELGCDFREAAGAG